MTLRRTNIRTQVSQEALAAEEAARKKMATDTPTISSTETEENTAVDTSPETAVKSSTAMATPTKADTETLPETPAETYAYSEEELEALVKRNKRGKNIFERTHERLTIWVLKSKKKRFGKLADRMGISQVALMDEALDDLFKKYRWP